MKMETIGKLLAELIEKFANAISAFQQGDKVPDAELKVFVANVCKEAMKFLDKDNDGQIDKDEFMVFITWLEESADNFQLDPNSIGEFVDKKALDDLWDKYDADGGGDLDLKELENMMFELLSDFTKSTQAITPKEDILRDQAKQMTKSLLDYVKPENEDKMTKEEFSKF
eukprot:UN33851